MTNGKPLTGPGTPPGLGGPRDRQDGQAGPAIAVVDSAAPPPDIQVTGNRLFLTLDLEGTPAESVAHYLGTNLLVIWRKESPQESARLIRLPVDVESGEAILRITNNVFDLAAPVARGRARPASATPHPEGSA
jgi:hypothetical protein